MASLRLVLTFEDKAPLIVALSGIDPAMLGRLFDWLGLVVDPIVAFLDALLTLCANTQSLLMLSIVLPQHQQLLHTLAASCLLVLFFLLLLSLQYVDDGFIIIIID